MATAKIIHGACLDVLPSLPDNSVDAVITDPPYGLSNATPEKITEAITRWAQGDRDFLPEVSGGFMGKAWDSFVPPVAVWDDCMRVLKPGGHMVVFAGSRTFDLMALAIRLAGFEIRDSLAWLYGSGFPKSLDVSKAIDKAAGAEREIVGTRRSPYTPTGSKMLTRDGRASEGYRPAEGDPSVFERNVDADGYKIITETAPATDAARQWEGWGTALKPAFEPVVLARKPLVGTVAANVLEHGTGALNIDGCRIEGTEDTARPQGKDIRGGKWSGDGGRSVLTTGGGTGRWPANVVLDEDQAAALDQQSGFSKSPSSTGRGAGGQHGITNPRGAQGKVPAPGDSGGASRFFYTAKAPKKERPVVDGIAHPTVKPLALMRWLVRLVTPPGGTVLEPFAGSGTTVEAALLEGFDVVGVEREADYLPLIQARIDRAQDAVTSEPEQPDLFAS